MPVPSASVATNNRHIDTTSTTHSVPQHHYQRGRYRTPSSVSHMQHRVTAIERGLSQRIRDLELQREEHRKIIATLCEDMVKLMTREWYRQHPSPWDTSVSVPAPAPGYYPLQPPAPMPPPPLFFQQQTQAFEVPMAQQYFWQPPPSGFPVEIRQPPVYNCPLFPPYASDSSDDERSITPESDIQIIVTDSDSDEPTVKPECI